MGGLSPRYSVMLVPTLRVGMQIPQATTQSVGASLVYQLQDLAINRKHHLFIPFLPGLKLGHGLQKHRML